MKQEKIIQQIVDFMEYNSVELCKIEEAVKSIRKKEKKELETIELEKKAEFIGKCYILEPDYYKPGHRIDKYVMVVSNHGVDWDDVTCLCFNNHLYYEFSGISQTNRFEFSGIWPEEISYHSFEGAKSVTKEQYFEALDQFVSELKEHSVWKADHSAEVDKLPIDSDW